jgi:hypothetical protein
LVPDDWREKYERIKLLHSNNEKLEKTHTIWIRNQKSRFNKVASYAPLCEEQIMLLDHLFTSFYDKSP